MKKLEFDFQLLFSIQEQGYNHALPQFSILSNTRLREVTLFLGNGGSDVPLDTFLPCSQLAVLDLEPRRVDYTQDDYLEFKYRHHIVHRILRQSPNLIIFGVDVADPIPHEPYPPTKFSMKNLKRLSLTRLVFSLGPLLDFLHSR